jgi:hypothetical protein
MRIFLIVALAAILGGCASATRGWNEQIQFDSHPTGATVRTAVVDPFCMETTCPTEAGPACVTPCVVQVARRDRLRVTFTKDGYEPQVVPVDVRVAGQGAAGFVGNVILGGVIGMVVDGASGATLEHFPNPVTVVLNPISPSVAPPPSAPPRSAPPAPQRLDQRDRSDPWRMAPGS